MTLIDNYNRMCMVYLLKYKFEYFKTFKQFHTIIKKEEHTPIVTLHFDNIYEYSSNEFIKYHSQYGIKYQTIIPYNI